MLYDRRIWHHMFRYFMPELRRGIIVCEFAGAQPRYSQTIQIREEKIQEGGCTIREFAGTAPDTVSPTHGGMHSGISNNTHGHCHMALKSNLLYDIALVPNIGLEYAFNRGWSIGCGWQYAWWKMTGVTITGVFTVESWRSASILVHMWQKRRLPDIMPDFTCKS